MDKKIKIITILGIGAVAVTSVITSNAFNIEEKTFSNLDKDKILEIDFNDNLISNKINNKSYNSINNQKRFVSSVKGNGFEANGDYAVIPNSDLSISESDEYMTVSFKYKYGGQDSYQMFCSFGHYDLWMQGGWFGFNTGNSDMYGFQYTPPTDEFISIVATFHKTDITKNEIYINGIRQTLSYMNDYRSKIPSNPFKNDFYIFNWQGLANGYVSDKSIIDEIEIFKRNVTSTEVNNLKEKHKIPDINVVRDGSKVKTSWSTTLLPEDTIYQTGFEPGDDINDTGNHGSNSISSLDKYSGNNSLKITDGVVNGNNGDSAGNRSARYDFNTINGITVGMKFTANVKVKDTNPENQGIGMSARGGLPRSTNPFNAQYGFSQPIIVAEDTSNTPGLIKIENFDYLYNGLRDNFLYFASNKQASDYSASPFTFRKDNLDMTNKAIRANGSYKKGDVLHHINIVYPLSLGSKSTGINSDWNSYSFNGEVRDLDYDTTRGMIPYFITGNKGTMYVDDFKFGYATKVNLYRNNSKIYEGYESDFIDNNVTDTTAPNQIKISDIKSNMSISDDNTRKIVFDFLPVTDIGSTYNYQISAISKTGVETPKSTGKSVEVNSGLKGYSYVVDKKPNTVPNNEINTTNNTITQDIGTDSGVYYLHIKSIDNAGNISDVTHYKMDIPILTATPKPSENMIRLDWAMNSLNDKTFKVFQKKPGDNEFQSISATDLSKSKKVKTLLVYPNTGCGLTPLPTTSYVDINGNTITIPTSASLKKWIEEPKSEAPLGYGKGLINVDIVELDEFNANPSNYLKENEEYKYDVLAFGIADCNGSKGINDLARIETEKFVETGRGLFFGHDSVYNDVIRNNYAILAKKYMDMDIVNTGAYRDTQVEITKKGLLTNFPWNIGEVGTKLTIPLAHTSSQRPNDINDNWLKFANDTSSIGNFYLTTKNNLAMSQTGHSTGQATEDEMKILANTLFYLNQLSSENFLNDNSGQDTKAPNKPNIYEHNYLDSGEVEFKFNEVQDNGDEYEYYVESKDKNDVVALSNTVKTEIKTGLKGYSYVIDKNASTIPDNTIEMSTAKTIKVKNNAESLYVHIKAIDNAGNSSETLHYKLSDVTKPTLELTLAPNSWTNGNVTINAKATDSDSGIKQIILPNGNIINNTTASFIVSENGIYYFKAIDIVGNETISSITVSNIDKKKPTVTINNNTNWTNTDVGVTITATDE